MYLNIKIIHNLQCLRRFRLSNGLFFFCIRPDPGVKSVTVADTVVDPLRPWFDPRSAPLPTPPPPP